MRLKIFTLKFSNAADGFDDAAMQEFLADKEVIETREHFYVHERIPYFNGPLLRAAPLPMIGLRKLRPRERIR